MKIGRWVGRFFALIGFLTVSFFTLLVVMMLRTTPSREKLPESFLLKLNMALHVKEKPTAEGLQDFMDGPSLSLQEMIEGVKKAVKDPQVKGLLIKVDGLSMGLSQLEELREALKHFRHAHKPVVVFAESFGEVGSGLVPYFFASCADRIVMQDSGYLNLTGLQAEIPYFAQLMEDFGVKFRVGQREEYKNAMASFTDKTMSSAQRQATQSLLTSLFGAMVGYIMHDRELTFDHVWQTMADMPLMTAENAKKQGFIDHISSIEDLESSLRKDNKEASFVSFLKYVHVPHQDDLSDDDVDAPEIAIIYAQGMIQQQGNHNFLDDEFLTPISIKKVLRDLDKASNLKAIVLRIDSPGGSAVASDSIYKAIRHFAQEKKIPVVGSLGDVAASGGYWIACACDTVVANRLTITGSIGVVTGKPILGGLMDKFKVGQGIVTVGPNGSLWSQTQDYTDHQWSLIQGTLDDIYGRFMQLVSIRRHLPMDHVRQVAKGRVWTGIEAKKFGLVDTWGGMETAVSKAKELAKIPETAECLVRSYPLSRGVYERLTQLLSGGGEEDRASSPLIFFRGVWMWLKQAHQAFFPQTLEANGVPKIL
jgi:protease-4